jgi:hydroxyacylglutathione hydrolase
LYVSDEGPADWKYQYVRDYPHQLLKDGDRFSVGNVEFEALHTPGHTPESMSFLLTDRGGGANRPMGIFTGDFVFVGSIGRPDLLEEAAGIAGTAEPGARDLYRSIQRFRQLPDFLQVWPAHGAGSACGKGLGAIPSSTVGYEKLFNPALQFSDEREFVAYVLAEQPEPPRYFALMKKINKEGPRILGGAALPAHLPVSRLTPLLDASQVVDVASGMRFAEAHVPKSISIEPKYLAMWGGSLIDYSQPVYLIASSRELPEAVRVLRKIGVESFGGYFDAEEVAAAGLSTATIPQATPAQLAERIHTGAVELIDVRGSAERREVRVAESSNYFLGKMLLRPMAYDRHKAYAFLCRTGGRSLIAASIARRLGAVQVMNVQGGIEAWQRAGLPVVHADQGAEGACPAAAKFR